MKRIFNVQTNALILPLYKESEVMYERFDFDEASGGYIKRFQMRKEPKIEDTVQIAGTPQNQMRNPEFTDVSEANFKLLEKCPGWAGLVKDGFVRVEDAPKP